MPSELDSAVSDRITDDIREFDVFLLVPQVLEDYVNTTRVNVRDDVEACVRARDVDESYAAGREATANVRVSEVDASQHGFRTFTNAADSQMLTASSHVLDQKIGPLQKSHDALTTKISQFDDIVFTKFAEQDKQADVRN